MVCLDVLGGAFLGAVIWFTVRAPLKRLQEKIGNFVNSAIAGKVLTLQPIVATGSRASLMGWRCGYRATPPGMEAVGANRTDVALQFLPGACRA